MIDITDITSRDGTRHASPLDAVKHFMCPGPCNPDCPLYPTNTLKNGHVAHMCHPEIVAAYPLSVLDAMQCSYCVHVGGARGGGATEGPKYVAVIRASAVRDVQFATVPDADLMDEDAWSDLEDAEIYIGIFSGPDALSDAAVFGRTDPANVRLIPVDGDGKGGKSDG